VVECQVKTVVIYTRGKDSKVQINLCKKFFLTFCFKSLFKNGMELPPKWLLDQVHLLIVEGSA